MRRSIIVALCCACGGGSAARPAEPAAKPAPAHHGHAAHHHEGAQPLGHRFTDAERWGKVFDDPARDRWQQPDKVVAALDLRPGMTVADVGAGTGYFEARLSAAVGAQGKVLAVDVEPDMVRYLGERAKREGTANVEARLATPSDPGLARESVDRILVVDTWHHIPDRVAYSQKLYDALRPGGFILVVDFTMETSKGPPRNHRIAPDVVIVELEGVKTFTEAGKFLVELVELGLPDQYVIKAERPRLTL